MKHTRILVTLATGLVLAAVVAGAAESAAPRAQARPEWKAEDALPLTCAQAWTESGKTYKGLLAVVKTLAIVSLANRDLEFPDTREAGMDAGKGIVADCKADPDALLFAIVDKHVRRVAEAAE
jgi:hypothetical protein